MPETLQDSGTVKTSTTDVISRLTNAITIGSAATFILSVIHESAYFSIIGSKFRSVATLADYFTTALDWLPWAVTVVILYWLVLMLPAVMSVGPIERRAVASPKPDKPSAIANAIAKIPFNVRAVCTILLFGVFDAIIYFKDDPANRDWAFFIFSISFGIWWFVLALAKSNAGSLKREIGDNLTAIMLLVPAVTFGAFVVGVHDGYSDLSRPGKLYRLVLKKSDVQNPLQVELLRVLDRGVLLRLPERQINEFVRWDEIRSLSLQRDGESGKSLGCRQLGWPC